MHYLYISTSTSFDLIRKTKTLLGKQFPKGTPPNKYLLKRGAGKITFRELFPLTRHYHYASQKLNFITRTLCFKYSNLPYSKIPLPLFSDSGGFSNFKISRYLNESADCCSDPNLNKSFRKSFDVCRRTSLIRCERKSEVRSGREV